MAVIFVSKVLDYHVNLWSKLILNDVQTVPNDLRERSMPKVEETMEKLAKKCRKFDGRHICLKNSWFSCQFVIQTQLLGILNEVQTVPNDFRERSLPKVEERMKKWAKKSLKIWRPSYLSQKFLNFMSICVPNSTFWYSQWSTNNPKRF